MTQSQGWFEENNFVEGIYQKKKIGKICKIVKADNAFISCLRFK